MKKRNITNKKILRFTSEKNSYLITAPSTKASGKRTNAMGMASRFGQTAQSMRESGVTIKRVAEESFGTLMATYLMATGKRTRHMAEVSIFM